MNDLSTPSVDTIPVRNPRTGESDYQFTPATPKEIAASARRLRGNQPAWEAAGVDHRIEVLRRFSAEISARETALRESLEIDTGRAGISALEAGFLGPRVEYLAHNAPAALTVPAASDSFIPGISGQPQYVAVPLVGNITPWNFPFILSMIDTLSALVAGSSVIVKPSEVACRFVAPVREALAAVPELADVCEFVLGDGAVGAELIRHIDAVSFTGSVRTGRKVYEAAARNFIPAFLELGGKDPLIVMPDADLDLATDIALRASVAATGQACQSIERTYVPRDQHDAFVDMLVNKARKVTINHPDIREGHVGPFIFAEQANIVRRQLEDAKAKGARVLTGGEVFSDGGHWLRPTVVVDIDHSMQLMTDETFGPVIPVMAYDTVDEAVALANDSRYGLSANVVGANIDEAVEVGKRLNAGAISVNDGSLTAMVHEFEHQAFKESGLGASRMGLDAMRRFLRKKVLLVNRGRAASIEGFREPPASGD